MNPRRTLEVTIELTSPDTFDVQFLDPESGDYCCISCTDERTNEHDMRLSAEIRSWVEIMREEQAYEETEAFARKYHEDSLNDEAGDADEFIDISYNEARKDVVDFLNSRPPEWFEEYDRTKWSVLNDAQLIEELVNEHLRCVNRYGCDRQWSVEDACTSNPGIC